MIISASHIESARCTQRVGLHGKILNCCGMFANKSQVQIAEFRHPKRGCISHQPSENTLYAGAQEEQRPNVVRSGVQRRKVKKKKKHLDFVRTVLRMQHDVLCCIYDVSRRVGTGQKICSETVTPILPPTDHCCWSGFLRIRFFKRERQVGSLFRNDSSSADSPVARTSRRERTQICKRFHARMSRPRAEVGQSMFRQRRRLDRLSGVTVSILTSYTLFDV